MVSESCASGIFVLEQRKWHLTTIYSSHRLGENGKLTLIDSSFIFRMAFYVLRKPFVKFLVRIEQCRHNEMQKSPKFGHAVLNRRTAQQQSIATIETEQQLPSHRGGTLNGLRLIQNQILPFDSIEILVIGHNQLVTGDDHMKTGLTRVQIFGVPKLT